MSEEKRKRTVRYIIYTDGSHSPKRGGVAAYWLVDTRTSQTEEGVAKFTESSPERMELQAVIMALQSLDGTKKPVLVYSDSMNVVRVCQLYVSRKPYYLLGNEDLWAELFPMLDEMNVIFKWIKGHNGYGKNEHCDRLAKRANKFGKL